MTRKRDFVDVCVSDAGRRGGCPRERGSSWPPDSAWADHREAWERAGKGRQEGDWDLLGILAQTCFFPFLIL